MNPAIVDEVPVCMMTEEMIGKPIMFVREKLLLDPELNEVPGGEVTEEVVYENQTGLEGPYTVKKGISHVPCRDQSWPIITAEMVASSG